MTRVLVVQRQIVINKIQVLQVESNSQPFLLYHLLFTVSRIPYSMCLSVMYHWISYSISYSLI